MRQMRFTSAADITPDSDAPDAPVYVSAALPRGYIIRTSTLFPTPSRFIADGYTIYVLSDGEKQIERLRAIFADRGDSGIVFTPVISTVHEGFVDHKTKSAYLPTTRYSTVSTK